MDFSKKKILKKANVNFSKKSEITERGFFLKNSEISKCGFFLKNVDF